MPPLVDLFGYLGILLHGLVIVSQSLALGGALFLVLPGAPVRGSAGARARAPRGRHCGHGARCAWPGVEWC